MNTMTLSAELAFRLSRDPALYAAAPFLKPMETPTLELHTKLKAKCSSCNKRPILMAQQQIGHAMASLILDESKRPNNQLIAFKQAAAKLLNTTIDEMTVGIKAVTGESIDIRF